MLSLWFCWVQPAVLQDSDRHRAKPNYLGLSLIQALDQLKQHDLNIIYSSRLVRPGMRVRAEPRSVEPRKILEELLAPHGLTVRAGPGGSLLVVKIQKKTALPRFEIYGRVRSAEDGRPLGGVRISVQKTLIGSVSDEAGRFHLTLPAAGAYVIEVGMDGFLPVRLKVPLEETLPREILVDLYSLESFTILEKLVVTPSSFTLLSEGPAQIPLLSSREIDRLPRITDDLYRALSRLPGTAGGDISAKFSIRGGEQNEVLVLLDGLEIYEPYHLKDLLSIFSVFDSRAIGHVNFLSGGFPAKFGDRMSGVIDMSTIEAQEHWTSEIGFSFLNARLLSSDRFHGGRGKWFVSMRRGFLDLIRAIDRVQALDTEERDEKFKFADAQMKFEYHLNDRLSLTFNALRVEDRIRFSNEDNLLGTSRLGDIENASLEYEDSYLWLNGNFSWSERLASNTQISWGELNRERRGNQNVEDRSIFGVDDLRNFDFYGLKQNFQFSISPRHFLQWGLGLKHFEGNYDYESRLFETSPLVTEGGPPVTRQTRVAATPSGEQFHAYVSHRLRLWEPFALELGLRWDRQTYLAQVEDQLSPRLNLNLNLGARTILRAGWGRFHQSQAIYELQVEDGVGEFQSGQNAEHRVLSLEHRFASGFFLKLDGYHKQVSHPRLRFENRFKPLAFFPESEPDRVAVAPRSARSRGVELFLKNEPAKRLSWWLGYGLADAEDLIDGRWVPRQWDQRHSFQFGINLEAGRGWSLNLASNYHSGRPTTRVTAVALTDEGGTVRAKPVYGPRNAERLPDFRRLDLRATHQSKWGRGELTCFLEVANLLNRENICCVEHRFRVEPDGTVTTTEEYDNWLPIIPSLGVSYKF